MEVTGAEKNGKMSVPYPRNIANSLAEIGLKQFKSLDKINIIRKKNVNLYFEKLKNISGIKIIDSVKNSGAIFLRYPVMVEEKYRNKILLNAKKSGYILGDWYSTLVAPVDTKNSVEIENKLRELVESEKVCMGIINLPTSYELSEKNVEEICKIIIETVKNGN